VDQLAWYEGQATRDKHWYQTLKVIQLVVAAAIPVVAALGAGAAVAGVLGAVIVTLEGIQQLFQFQQNWTSYRGTAEALKHEKFLFLAGADRYARAERPTAALAERVEGLVSREHAAWASSQREAAGRAVPQAAREEQTP
jgi:hypothetical protein